MRLGWGPHMCGPLGTVHARSRRAVHAPPGNRLGMIAGMLTLRTGRDVRRSLLRRVAFAAALPVLAGALLAAGALAAKPKHGARFSGHTGEPPVVGFLAPVKFTVAPNGRALYNFTFGTFGCFGAGGFRQGVNPYTGNSLINAGRIKVSANGHVSQKALSGYTVDNQTTTTSIMISARFSKAKKVSGTITFSQVVTGTVHASCGPAKLSFTASAH